MTAPDTAVEAQLESLLKLVDQQRETRCRELIADAERRADELVREARHEARVRVQNAIKAERERLRTQVEATRAQIQTRTRQRRQQTALLLLERGWERLRHGLTQGWRDSLVRRAWTEAVVEQGLKVLPAAPWRIEHQSELDPAALGQLPSKIAETTGHSPTFVPDQDLEAGLRVLAAGACLDGTVEGLLANRPDVDARLLAELSRLFESGPGAAAEAADEVTL